jgi:ribosomal-protein-alanine N-acetyltransferase
MVQIRRASIVDLPEIRRLEQLAPTAAHWSTAQYEELFVDGSLPRVTFVAVNSGTDSQVVGFLIARPAVDDWEIENVVVAEAHRKRGVGSALVRELVRQAQALKVGSIILEVRESNASARRLYENIGFTCEGRRKSYYRQPQEDAILYRRSLQFCDKIP